MEISTQHGVVEEEKQQKVGKDGWPAHEAICGPSALLLPLSKPKEEEGTGGEEESSGLECLILNQHIDEQCLCPTLPFLLFLLTQQWEQEASALDTLAHHSLLLYTSFSAPFPLLLFYSKTE